MQQGVTSVLVSVTGLAVVLVLAAAATLVLHPALLCGSGGSSAASFDKTRLSEIAAMAQPLAIVILGGGGPDESGQLPLWVQRRAELALEKAAAFEAVGRKVIFIALSGGTAHLPNSLDAEGRVIHESTATADFLVQHGVDPTRIYKEWASYDTIGNAYFLRTTLTDIRGWRDLLVITSEFHMPRTRAIFDHVFALNEPVPPYTLEYAAASDEGVDPEGLAARTAREQRSAVTWSTVTAPSLHTLAELHEWLYQEHGCYAVAKHGQGGDKAAAAALYAKRNATDASASALGAGDKQRS